MAGKDIPFDAVVYDEQNLEEVLQLQSSGLCFSSIVSLHCRSDILELVI